MRRILTLAAALVALTAFATLPPVHAQIALGGLRLVGPATGAVTAVDKTVAMYVKYVGTTAGKPTVESTGTTITFKIAGSVDATVGCPTIGTGIVDLTNASCDTLGEVINKTMGQSANWILVPGALLSTDTINGLITTVSVTDTNIKTSGVPIYWNNSPGTGTLDVAAAVIGPPTGADAKFWTLGQSAGVNANPFSDTYTFLAAFSEKQTSTGTIGDTIVYAVKGVFSGVLGSTATYSETSRVAWQETGGATTVVSKEDFSSFPLIAAPGEHFVVRISSSTSITAVALVGAGAFAKPF